MHIAQISPLEESVPPKLYGGTERVVAFLTEELIRQGHQVTLFASGDSETSAELVACSPRALRLDEGSVDQLAHHVRMLEEVRALADGFDVLHFHIDYIHFPMARALGWRSVTTLHGRLDIPDLRPLYRTYDDAPLVSISDAQRQPLPFANWRGTVHHGLPRDLLAFHPGGGKYLAFLGRLSRAKRVDRAIEIAKRVGMPLKIAAKFDPDPDERPYYDQVKPMFDHPLIEFVGEINEAQKGDFLGNAAALLFPIDWPEPFGLVMVEALACGTPVVAYRKGSVPEVMRHGVSGFVVDSVDDAVKATERALGLSRRRCRDYFEERFTVERMARDYLQIYADLPARAAGTPEPRERDAGLPVDESDLAVDESDLPVDESDPAVDEEDVTLEETVVEGL
jgi:glycosyltransferase involved in cell wall biosynthesis